MSIILNSINSGLILSLIAISFYVCSSKLKFANIALGSCFCVSGFLSALLFNFTGSLFLAVIIPFLFNIILRIDDHKVTGEISDSQLSAVNIWKWYKGNSQLSMSESPIIRKPGELVDFETNELQFSINHPVNILP